MIRRIIFVVALVMSGANTSVAQHSPSPYADEQAREIKALSQQEIQQFLAGAGMGFAKAAELNSYPGPKHVLELAAELQLTPKQATRTRRIRAEMSAETQRLGKFLVAAEVELDAHFSNGSIDEAGLRAATESIAALRGQIRASHLFAHLQLKTVLTQHQVHLYDLLRGYGDSDSSKHTNHH